MHAVKSLEIVATSLEGRIADIRFVSQPSGIISAKGACYWLMRSAMLWTHLLIRDRPPEP